MRICESVGGRRHLVRAALGAAFILVPTAAAAPASAATLSLNKPCYVSAGSKRAAMNLLGSGFVPGDMVEISSSDGSVATSTTVNASGDIAATTGAPIPAFSLPGAKAVTLTAQDFTAAGTTITATARTQAAQLAVDTKPAQARLSKKVTWYFSGFKPGRFIYGHYLHNKPVARAKFGRAKGPCGVLKVKAQFYPGGHPRFKSYGLQIDDSTGYSKHASPRIVTRLGTFVI
jgi:hypothetical protein